MDRLCSLIDLSQARAFSKLDLAQGYHQIAMEEDSVEKAAFCTNLDQWEYLVMPFGLCNAPKYFPAAEEHDFSRKEINSFVLVYLDDILIYSYSMWRSSGSFEESPLDKLPRA